MYDGMRKVLHYAPIAITICLPAIWQFYFIALVVARS